MSSAVKPLILLSLLVAGPTAVAAQELPIPPLPPDNLQMAVIAPVPDLQAHDPLLGQPPPSVNVKLYRAQTYDTSLGFTPGSRYQSTEDRKPIQTPGLSFSVPLQ